MLSKTEPGNDGNIGIYFLEPEITPNTSSGEFRWDRTGSSVTGFPPEIEVRALVEGQLIAKRVHCQRLGYTVTQTSRILATGGASENTAILQV